MLKSEKVIVESIPEEKKIQSISKKEFIVEAIDWSVESTEEIESINKSNRF